MNDACVRQGPGEGQAVDGWHTPRPGAHSPRSPAAWCGGTGCWPLGGLACTLAGQYRKDDSYFSHEAQMVIIDSGGLARGGRSRGGHRRATAVPCVQKIRFKVPHWQGICQRVGPKGLFCDSRIFQSQQTGRMLGTLARRAKRTLPSCCPALDQGLESPQAQPAPGSPGHHPSQHPSPVSSWLSAR